MKNTYLVDGFMWVNLAVSLATAWICICRMSAMSHQTTRDWLRLAYAVIFAAAFACGASPWLFGEDVGLGTVLVSCALLNNLLASAPLWKEGVPDFGRSDVAPLDGLHVERRKAWR